MLNLIKLLTIPYTEHWNKVRGLEAENALLKKHNLELRQQLDSQRREFAAELHVIEQKVLPFLEHVVFLKDCRLERNTCGGYNGVPTFVRDTKFVIEGYLIGSTKDNPWPAVVTEYIIELTAKHGYSQYMGRLR